MKSNSLTNLVLGISALGAVATGCKSAKEFTSYHENIPQATVENFNIEEYLFNSLTNHIKENPDTIINNDQYKHVTIDLASTGFTQLKDQVEPRTYLLRLTGNNIEFIKQTVQKEKANEFYRISLADGRRTGVGINAASGYHVTKGEFINQGKYNSFQDLNDKGVEAFERAKVFLKMYLANDQLKGEKIWNDALKTCPKTTSQEYSPTTSPTESSTPTDSRW